MYYDSTSVYYCYAHNYALCPLYIYLIMTDYEPDVTCNFEISTLAHISDMGYNFLFQIRAKSSSTFPYVYMLQLNDYVYDVRFLLVLALTDETTIILPGNEAF